MAETNVTPQTNTQAQPVPTGQTAATAVPPDLLGTTVEENPRKLPPRKVKLTGRAAQKAVFENQVTAADKIVLKTRRNPKGAEYSGANVPGAFTLEALARNTISVNVNTTKLTNKNGELGRDQYNPTKEAESFLNNMNLSQRKGFLNSLYTRGFYTSKQGPGLTGMDNQSFRAAEQYLTVVNQTGFEEDVARKIVFANFAPIQGAPGTGGGTARRYTVSADADIDNIANKVAEQIIGRRLTASEVTKIISKVQSKERAAALSTATETKQAPSPQTIAEQMIESGQGQEAAMMRFGQLGSSIDALLKGM